jgi:hypothetical protein
VRYRKESWILNRARLCPALEYLAQQLLKTESVDGAEVKQALVLQPA